MIRSTSGKIHLILAIAILLVLVGLTGCGLMDSSSGGSGPLAPEELTVEIRSASEIRLRWNDMSSNEDGFEIEQSIGDNTAYIVIDSTEGSSLTVSDLAAMTTYYYRVRSYNMSGNSPYCDEVSVTMPPYAPDPPTNLVAEVISSTEIRLTWMDMSDVEDGFELEESIGGISYFRLVGITGQDTTELILHDREQGVTYYYRARAFNAGGNSPYSDRSSAIIPDDIPTTPADLEAEAVSSTEIQLTWIDMSFDEGGFEIEESVGDNSHFQAVDSTHQDITSITLSDRIPITTYYYRIRAYNIIGRSGYSSEVIAITPPVELWSQAFGGENDDECRLVCATSDGGYIMAGTTRSYGSGSDAWLIKTNESGDQQWQQRYGGAELDDGVSVRQTDDGGYIMAGTSYSYGNGTADILLVKTDGSGSEQWHQIYTGHFDDEDDVGFDIQPTTDGGFIIVGSTFSDDAVRMDAVMIKTDDSGDEQWRRLFGGGSDDIGNSILSIADGGYVVLGSTKSSGAGNWDVWLIRMNSNGDEQWARTFGGTSEDMGARVQLASDGGYIITGTTRSSGAGGRDVWLIKTNPEGNLEWEQTFGGREDDYGSGVQATEDGGYIVVGTTRFEDAVFDDIWLIKTDASGDLEWKRTFGGRDDDYGRDVLQTSANEYIILGKTYSVGSGAADAWLVKVGPQQ